jgi:DNA-directed RNA polymerase subunit M/transcription elongation factor TFIIS
VAKRSAGSVRPVSGWSPRPTVEFGCDYCAEESNFHYHLEQIGSDERRLRILLRCPDCGTLYENTATGADDIRRLTEHEAAALFPGHQ